MVQKSLRVFVTLILISGLAFLVGCNNSSVQKPLRIALSSANENYVNWIHRGDSMAEIIDMKGMRADSALKLLTSCDAIVFTGGEDVVPGYYGKEYDSARCETNPARDSLEFALIKESMRLQMPVFGVCRGQQILNVSLGGTLIVDIPSDHPGNVIHQCEDYLHCFHTVKVARGSQLYHSALADTGMVTTNHHQAIEKPAPGIRVVAWSTDSIAEAIEWEDPARKAFLMAVQWHPERMDSKSPLSMPLLNSFLKAATNYRIHR